MNTLDRIEADLDEIGESCPPPETLRQLCRVARAAQAIDLREDDLPHTFHDIHNPELSRRGVTRERIQALHLELSPLLAEPA